MDYSISRRNALAGGGSLLAGGIGIWSIWSKQQTSDPSPRTVTEASMQIDQWEKLQGSASIQESTISDANTATLALSIKWTGNNARSVGFSSSIPFPTAAYDTESPSSLILVTSSRSKSLERINDQTWLPSRAADGRLGNTLHIRSYTFEPNERQTWIWNLWGDPRSVAYIEPGKYSFQEDCSSQEPNVRGFIELNLTIESK
ncbi:hypothetical protein [Halorientalis salina]|uniref:hypothetical protein n=1 Tax=Halorientalis salina TaxID=2932266 RepID=UPI0010ABB014|nr:hypothetical protein [Halorientalis salina]